ncbi:MAG: hypothetical protein L0G27_00970, partial [Paracoccus sp. (in: a-proteobacteria)]|nr:hypothetical protein [Paracoccus sp. (in: a-proteobacteria)]
LQLAGIRNMAAGNVFLLGVIARHNLRFVYAPARPDNLHRPVHLPTSRLNAIICIGGQQQVGASPIVHCERRTFILDDNEHAHSAIGRSVEIYPWPDRPFGSRWKDILLHYGTFGLSRQNVTQAAITKNTRIGDVLAAMNTQQEANPSKVGSWASSTPVANPKPSEALVSATGRTNARKGTRAGRFFTPLPEKSPSRPRQRC